MVDNLDKYRKMRDFASTPEPEGDSSKLRGRSPDRPVFVIQKHQASHLHYDFRLEIDDVLKSWAVPKGPSYDPAVKRLAMMTEDHPMEYGSFEGVIPAGNYGAGNVIIWDEGEWEYLEPGDDPSTGLSKGKLTIRMFGRKMFGEWALVKLGGSKAQKGNEWLLFKHKDEWANPDVDVTEVAPLSVVSGRSVDELGEGDRTWRSNRDQTGKLREDGPKSMRESGRTGKRSSKRKSGRRGSKSSTRN